MPDMFYKSEIYVFMIIMFWFDDWISRDGICGCYIYKLHFLAGGVGPIYKRNSVEFLIDFLVLENLSIICPLGLVSSFHMGFDFRCMPYGFLGGVPGNRGPIQGHTTVAIYMTFGSRRDNFIGIKIDDF